MVNALNWGFDILMDPNGDLQRAMNVANPPVTFLIDQRGNIVYTHTGYVEGDEYELEDHIKELGKREENVQETKEVMEEDTQKTPVIDK